MSSPTINPDLLRLIALESVKRHQYVGYDADNDEGRKVNDLREPRYNLARSIRQAIQTEVGVTNPRIEYAHVRKYLHLIGVETNLPGLTWMNVPDSAHVGTIKQLPPGFKSLLLRKKESTTILINTQMIEESIAPFRKELAQKREEIEDLKERARQEEKDERACKREGKARILFLLLHELANLRFYEHGTERDYIPSDGFAGEGTFYERLFWGIWREITSDPHHRYYQQAVRYGFPLNGTKTHDLSPVEKRNIVSHCASAICDVCANEVASEVLMPTYDFRANMKSKRYNIDALATLYRLTRQTIAHRMSLEAPFDIEFSMTDRDGFVTKSWSPKRNILIGSKACCNRTARALLDEQYSYGMARVEHTSEDTKGNKRYCASFPTRKHSIVAQNQPVAEGKVATRKPGFFVKQCFTLGCSLEDAMDHMEYDPEPNPAKICLHRQHCVIGCTC